MVSVVTQLDNTKRTGFHCFYSQNQASRQQSVAAHTFSPCDHGCFLEAARLFGYSPNISDIDYVRGVGNYSRRIDRILGSMDHLLSQRHQVPTYQSNRLYNPQLSGFWQCLVRLLAEATVLRKCGLCS